jgi:hypothetical protein
MTSKKRLNIDRILLVAALIALWAIFLPVDSALSEKPMSLEELRDMVFITDFSTMSKEEKEDFFRKFKRRLLTAENVSRRRFERSSDFAVVYPFLRREDRDLLIQTMMPTPTRRILERLLALSPEERADLVDKAFENLPEPEHKRDRILPEHRDLLIRLLCKQSDTEVRQMFLQYFFRTAQEHERLEYQPLMDEVFYLLRDPTGKSGKKRKSHRRRGRRHPHP